jgi:DNA-binding MarR family transcriptional regulator
LGYAKLDRDAIHRLLWERRDRRGTTTFKSGELAQELGVTIWTMSRITQELIDAGRIKRLRAAQTNIKTYIVRDPEAFSETPSSGESSS